MVGREDEWMRLLSLSVGGPPGPAEGGEERQRQRLQKRDGEKEDYVRSLSQGNMWTGYLRPGTLLPHQVMSLVLLF